jgi:hypothetical protein
VAVATASAVAAASASTEVAGSAASRAVPRAAPSLVAPSTGAVGREEGEPDEAREREHENEGDSCCNHENLQDSDEPGSVSVDVT